MTRLAPLGPTGVEHESPAVATVTVQVSSTVWLGPGGETGSGGRVLSVQAATASPDRRIRRRMLVQDDGAMRLVGCGCAPIAPV